MLSSIRHTTTSWVAKVLFVILIFAFGAWGVGDIFRANMKSASVAKVGNQEYSEAQYRHDLRQALQAAQQQYPQVTMQQLKALGLPRQVVEQNIHQILLEVYGKQLGVGVPTTMVQQTIQTNQAFQGLDGKFSRSHFLQLLSQNGLDEASYVASVRNELQNRQLFRALFGAVAVPPQLTAEIYGYLSETRAADVLVIPAASIGDIPQPTDAALVQFHKDHSNNYMRPEYRAANILLLSPGDFSKGINVTDQEIAKDYDDHKAQYSTPETRDLEQIVVQDPAIADKILATLKSGKTFATAVKEVTGGNAIDLGSQTKDALQPKELQSVFGLAADAVSDPIKSAFGIHLVHVKAITPATNQTLDQVKDQIRKNLVLGKANDVLVGILNQLDDALGGGANISDAAKKLNLPVKSIDAVNSLGTDKQGKDLGLRPDVIAVIQQTQSGNTSQVVPLQDGSYVVVQVTGIQPPELKPLAEVEDQVKKDWIADQQRQAATNQAAQLITKLRNGGTLTDAAKTLKLTLKHSSNLTRSAGDPENGIDPELARKLFAAKVGDYVSGQTSDGAVIAQVTGITPAVAADHKEEAKLVADKLKQEISQELTGQFSVALQQQIPVLRNDQLVDKVLSEE